MSKEALMWDNMRDAKLPGLWLRIENLVSVGVPDVNYLLGRGIEGWVELKAAHEWPKRDDTALDVSHFTDDQRRWLSRRWRAGGAAYLFLKVGKGQIAEWLLFEGHTASLVVGNGTRRGLIDSAVWYHRGGFAKVPFLEVLRRGNCG